MQSRGEAQTGVVVEGGPVRAHRDPPPLLELVETSLDHVAPSVADPLLIAEVYRSASAPAAVRDLVIAFRDRRGDPALT